MRESFIKALIGLAEKDERVYLLSADLGFSLLESFRERFPQRFINVGVAEQNMIGVATGLALTGKVVFVYSIANFPTMRCLEQIRNDVCYHSLPIRIVAVGGGFAYGCQGYTHHGLEDIGVMRALSGMTVIVPCDPVETMLAIQALGNYPYPVYLRLGKSGESIVYQQEPEFVIGRSIKVKEGRDVFIIATGSMVHVALEGAEEVAKKGIDAGVLSMHTIKPLDHVSIIECARKTRRIVTIEEHGIGGLFSAVAEVIATSQINTRLIPIFVKDPILSFGGSQGYLRRISKVSLEHLIHEIDKIMKM